MVIGRKVPIAPQSFFQSVGAHPRKFSGAPYDLLELLPDQSVDRKGSAAADSKDKAYRPDEQYIFVAAAGGITSW
jgi:hypothetical protein